MARKLEVKIVGDASSLSRAFRQAGASGRSFGSTLGGVGKTAGLALAGGIAAAGGALVVFGREAAEAERVSAITESVIRSTGGAAHVTAEQVDALAQSIMRKTGVDDEAVKSAENLLLTFTKVRNEVGPGNDVFNQATTALVDMAAVLGGDASENAIRLGKALNDPVKGITALTRVGVTFSDAQKDLVKALVQGRDAMNAFATVFPDLDAAQQKTIKGMEAQGASITEIADALKLKLEPAQREWLDAMVAGGDIVAAQKLILNELATEFGGAAEAAGQTFAGQLKLAKESALNMGAAVVEKALPALTSLASSITSDVLPRVGEFASALGDRLKPMISATIDFIKTNWPAVKEVFRVLWQFIDTTVLPVVRALQEVFRTAVTAILGVVKEHMPQIRQILANVGDVIRAIAKVAMPLLKFAFGVVLPAALEIAIPVIEKVTGLLAKIAGVIGGAQEALAGLAGWFKSHWKDILAVIAPGSALFTDAFGIRSKIVSVFTTEIPAAFRDMAGWFAGHWKDILAVIVPASALFTDAFGIRSKIAAAFVGVGSAVSGPVGEIVAFFTDLPGRIAGTVAALKDTALAPLRTAFTGLKTFVLGIVNAIVGFFTDLPGKIVGVGKQLGEGFLDFLTEGFSGLTDTLIRIVKAPINAIIDALNMLKIPEWKIPGFNAGSIPGLGKIPGADKIGWGDITIPAFDPIPHIPRLARGGSVVETGLAVVHRGETVLPEGAGGLTVNIHAATVIGGDLNRLAAELAKPLHRELVRIAGRNVSMGLA